MSNKELIGMIYNRNNLQGSKRSNRLSNRYNGSKKSNNISNNKRREVSSGSKKSANYDRIITVGGSKKTEPRIPYRHQVLKQIANGKFGSKTYQDLAKKKAMAGNKIFINKKYPIADVGINNIDETKSNEDVELTIDIGPQSSVDPKVSQDDSELLTEQIDETNKLTEPITKEVNSSKDKQLTTEQQKNLIAKILASDLDPAKIKQKKAQNEPLMVQTKTIKTIADITKSSNKSVEITNLDKKIGELEDYIAIMSIDIEKLKNNQKQIVRAINRTSKNGSKSR